MRRVPSKAIRRWTIRSSARRWKPGLHYIDIADALSFVREIARFDALAKSRGVTVISGASSVPTLSSAVISELAQGWDAMLEVEIAISSSNQATLGRSVHAALLSYAGKPIRLRRFGVWRAVTGLTDWQSIEIRVPGQAPLQGRLVAPCEVPDLALLPARYPTLRKAIFRAGTELSVFNRGAGLLARLVSLRILRSLAPLAGLASRAFGLLHRFGSARSGMVVTATGRNGEDYEPPPLECPRRRRRWALGPGARRRIADGEARSRRASARRATGDRCLEAGGIPERLCAIEDRGCD